MCSVQAHCRWVCTGTPLQNRLSELGTLFQFLRVHLFDELNFFDREIPRPRKRASDSLPLEKLRGLVGFITIRRSKDVLNLLPRKDLVRRLHFRPSERDIYNSVKTRTIDTFPELCGLENSAKVSYLHILAWIDKLRKICNHGRINEPTLLPSDPHIGVPVDNDGDKNNETSTPWINFDSNELSSTIDLMDHVSQRLQEITSRQSISEARDSGVLATAIDRQFQDEMCDRDRDPTTPEFDCSLEDCSASRTHQTTSSTKILSLMEDLPDKATDKKRYGTLL